MAFIIDRYNKYDIWDRTHAKHIFKVNDVWYAVKEVELEWGIPQLETHTDYNDNATDYFIYNSYQDAMQFVSRMKSLN